MSFVYGFPKNNGTDNTIRFLKACSDPSQEVVYHRLYKRIHVVYPYLFSGIVYIMQSEYVFQAYLSGMEYNSEISKKMSKTINAQLIKFTVYLVSKTIQPDSILCDHLSSGEHLA